MSVRARACVCVENEKKKERHTESHTCDHVREDHFAVRKAHLLGRIKGIATQLLAASGPQGQELVATVKSEGGNIFLRRERGPQLRGPGG